MTTRKLALIVSVSALALMTACSSNPTRSVANDNTSSAPVRNAIQYGNVSRIDVVPTASRTSGGGAVLGAVLGAVIGNQVGGGTGRAAATGLGAVGGALIGNQVEKRNKAEGEVFRVSVRLDNGGTGQFDYERIDDLRVGDRVRVQDGQLHRV